MDCKDLRLQEYIEGGIKDARIEEHLDECVRCSAEYARMKALMEDLDGLSLFDVPEGFSIQVMEGIKAGKREGLGFVLITGLVFLVMAFVYAAAGLRSFYSSQNGFISVPPVFSRLTGIAADGLNYISVGLSTLWNTAVSVLSPILGAVEGAGPVLYLMPVAAFLVLNVFVFRYASQRESNGVYRNE